MCVCVCVGGWVGVGAWLGVCVGVGAWLGGLVFVVVVAVVAVVVRC